MVGQVEADEPGVAVVAAPRDQVRGLHPGGHLHDRRRGDVEKLGQLAGGLAVALREGRDHEVLADAHAVAGHGLVGGAAHQLGRSREEDVELGHRGSLSAPLAG